MFVFTFPGQGAQKIGMGFSLYQTFPAARHVFLEIDDILEQRLSRLIFEGSERDLLQTENTQPALYAVSMAVLNTLVHEFGWDVRKQVMLTAGHSLGEYAALVCAGSLSLTDGAKLLRVRGMAMSQAVAQEPGAMHAVLGLEVSKLEVVLKEASYEGMCTIANDNCPGQLVISGHAHALMALSDSLSQAGAKKIIPLNVNGAFHSPLMKPAEDMLATALESCVFSDPHLPIISNVTAQPVVTASQIPDLLLQQLCSRVRWTESMCYMLSQHPTAIVELGSGNVLSGLLGRMETTIPRISIETPQELESFVKTHL